MPAFLVIAIFYILAGNGAFAQSKPKKVLVIESYHKEYEWDRDYLKGIRDTLGSQYQIATFEMNTKRIDPGKFKEQASKAWSEYLKFKPDLIISGDDNALKLLADKYQSVKTPVVYLGINNNPRYYLKGAPSNITGVLERPLLLRSILNLKKILLRDVKKVMVMFDSGTTAKAIMNESFRDQNMIVINDIEVHIALIEHFDTWKNTVLALKKDDFDAFIVGLYHTITTQSGEHVPSNTILDWTSKNSSIPPFAFWKFTVGKGRAIGGLVLDGVDQGIKAAQITKKILENQVSPSEIYPVKSEDGELVFSKYELQRFKIALPRVLMSSATMLD